MKRPIAVLSVGLMAAAAALFGAGSAGAAGAGAGTVYVVHGIPATPVDVYVDGAKAINDFQPGTVNGPLELPAGTHKIAITAAGAKDASTPVISGTADLKAGANVSLVANLTAAGKPTLSVYSNDVSAIAAGQTRLVVRPTAAAPAVDVRAGGKVVLPGVTNPNQGVLNIPAGTVSADVTLAGTDTVVIGPTDLTLPEGTATFVHAIGSASGKTLGLVSFTISGLGSAPNGVPAGSGPAGPAVPVGVLVIVLLAGAGVVAISGRRLLGGRGR